MAPGLLRTRSLYRWRLEVARGIDNRLRFFINRDTEGYAGKLFGVKCKVKSDEVKLWGHPNYIPG